MRREAMGEQDERDGTPAGASSTAPATKPAGEADDADGESLGVFGVTHLMDEATHQPLSIGFNDVVDAVVLCQPHVMFDTHDALLKYVEPTHNVSYLQILPNLLANPPEDLEEEFPSTL